MSKYNLRKQNAKVCPRCQRKCLINQPKCPECGLIFARLEGLSNKEAKKAIVKGEKERVVYVKEPPADVKKWVALLLCGILGITGAHNFYLGRYKKAFYQVGCLAFSLIILFLNESAYYGTWWYLIIFYTFAPFGACLLIFWVMDFIKIFFEKYKIPGAIARPNFEKIKEDLGLEQTEEELVKLKLAQSNDIESELIVEDKLPTSKNKNNKKKADPTNIDNVSEGTVLVDGADKDNGDEKRELEVSDLDQIGPDRKTGSHKLEVPGFDKTGLGSHKLEVSGLDEVGPDRKTGSHAVNKYKSYNNKKSKKAKKK